MQHGASTRESSAHLFMHIPHSVLRCSVNTFRFVLLFVRVVFCCILGPVAARCVGSACWLLGVLRGGLCATCVVGDGRWGDG